MITPFVDEETRSATARVILQNDGRLKPGIFITGHINLSEEMASVVIPKRAVQTIDGETVVFVQDDDGFEPRDVHIGRRSEDHVEIVSGLEPGERYVASNVLALKAELNRAELEHAGHAH